MDSVTAHHPDHPGSDLIVSRKAFDVDLSREGYVLGHSDGTMPPPALIPAAQDGGQRSVVDQAELDAMRATIMALEERETAVAVRAVELDARERDLEDREELLAGQVSPTVQLQDPAPAGVQLDTETPPAPGESDDDRRARRAASERHRRATRRTADTPTALEATP